jgi:hypothetical protein
MSVDKVSPLPSSAMDPAGSKNGGYSRAVLGPRINGAPESARVTPAHPVTAQNSGALSPGQSLTPAYDATTTLVAISLEAEVAAASRLTNAGGALASMAYDAARAQQPNHPGSLATILPHDVLKRFTFAALRENSIAQGKPIIDALQSMAVADPSRLPSQNAAKAQYGLHTSFVADDNFGNPAILDLFITRTAFGAWEVAAFDRQNASQGGGFPFAAPPLVVDRLVKDLSTEQIVSSIVGQMVFPTQNADWSDGRPVLLVVAAAILISSIVFAFVVAREGHALVAFAIAAAGAYGATLAWRSKWPI